MQKSHHSLMNKPVNIVFFKYFFPSLLGLMLMSINILIDGIFVGNGVGSTALASVNLAVPVFSMIISISLWIGIGGGTVYSMHLGEGNKVQARSVFSLAFFTTLFLLVLIGGVGVWNVEFISKILGANDDTLPFVVDYLSIMFLFGGIMGLQNMLSIFIRNDGNPRLSMIALAVSALSNIGLNYYMIFILHLGVKGAAIATIIGESLGLFVLLIHFISPHSTLRTLSFKWTWRKLSSIFSIGFPSFLAEMGALVLIAGYNLSVVYLLGTDGVAAFSVINYLHGFMFLAFFGIESTLQPMISYYYGAGETNRIIKSVQVGEKAAFALGATLFTIGMLAAPMLTSLFGLESEEIKSIAVQGIRLFFIAYLFMGLNFIYMTYFQSIGAIRSSIWIVILRSFVFLLAFLLILPQLFGIVGVWLALPLSEFFVALLLFFFARKQVMDPFAHKQIRISHKKTKGAGA